MSFASVQGVYGTTGGASTSASAVLAANPTLGNLVCVGVQFDASISSVTVKDSNNNSYTVSPHSPSDTITSRSTYGFYLLSAPSNASKTITVAWTGTSDCQIWVEEFQVTGGSQVFDQDAIATGSGSATITTPSLTVAAGELLFCVAIPDNAHNITAPAAGANLGIWTGAHGGIKFGVQSEYDLSSASGAQAAQFTLDGTSSWTGTMMAFAINTGVTATTPTYYVGVFSKDAVLAVGTFDVGIPIRFGLYDDDFVAQFSGTVYAANVNAVRSVPTCVFDRDADVIGMLGVF